MFTCSCGIKHADAYPKEEVEGRVPAKEVAEIRARHKGEIEAEQGRTKALEGQLGEAGKLGERVKDLSAQLERRGLDVAMARAGITDPEANDELAMRYERVKPDAEGKRLAPDEWAAAQMKAATEGTGSKWLRSYLPEKAAETKAGETKSAATGAAATRQNVAPNTNGTAKATGAPIRITEEQYRAQTAPLMQRRAQLAGRNDAASLTQRAEIDATIAGLGEQASIPT